MRSMTTSLATLLVVSTISGTAVAATPSQPPATPGPFAVVFHEDSVIRATPQAIWGVIMDLPAYGAWNPWLLSATGDMSPGGSVTVQVVLNGSAQTAYHTVVTVEPYTRFCWKDAGVTAYFVPAQRCRTLKVLANGDVKLENELFLDGLLAWIGNLAYGASLKSGLAGETAALKLRAESL
jgi:hypothetical protein